MVYVFCALYAEASSLIADLDLKKQDNALKFDVFENENKNVRLILTGVGALKASAAVSSACTYYEVTSSDRLINFGTCAGTDEIGKVILANRITDQTTGRTYYPDMLVNAGLEEKALVSTSKIVGSDELANADPSEVYDMEAAGIYEAALFYVSQHCISFIKVISDHGGDEFSADRLRDIISGAEESISAYIELVSAQAQGDSESDMPCSVQAYISSLSEDMHCSQTMFYALRQIIYYAHLTGKDYKKIIDAFYDSGRLPAGSKSDGKRLLDELGEELI